MPVELKVEGQLDQAPPINFFLRLVGALYHALLALICRGAQVLELNRILGAAEGLARDGADKEVVFNEPVGCLERSGKLPGAI